MLDKCCLLFFAFSLPPVGYACGQQRLIETDSTIFAYFREQNVTIDSCSNYYLYNELCIWVDTPYRYGASSLQGTDCSGFVKNIYRRVYNIELSGSSGELFTRCVPLKQEFLEEGDLVFFNISGKTVSHVGIYLRDNKFIHASVSLGVIVSDITDNYYAGRFCGGGRYILSFSE